MTREEYEQQLLMHLKKQEFIQALDAHVQTQINIYNVAKNTVFESVKSCALYATQAKQRPHDPFCQWIWEYKDDVFDYAGNELVKIQQGKRAMPSTTEELLAEIEAKYPIQTQTFIGN